MDLLRHQHSRSSPATLTPAAARHKRRAMRNETRHPVYRGVRQKNGGKWVCEVQEPNKKSRIWLGTFPSPETAAVAHDVAALALRGENAPLNFPDAATKLPRPQSASHEDIQRAASEAAREFRPASSPSLTCIFKQEKEVSDSTVSSEAEDSAGEVGGFVDEEAVFNLPALLDSMAEGMLLTPLALKKGFKWSEFVVDDEQGIDLNLWGD